MLNNEFGKGYNKINSLKNKIMTEENLAKANLYRTKIVLTEKRISCLEAALASNHCAIDKIVFKQGQLEGYDHEEANTLSDHVSRKVLMILLGETRSQLEYYKNIFKAL